jgi:hypothetical protein
MKQYISKKYPIPLEGGRTPVMGRSAEGAERTADRMAADHNQRSVKARSQEGGGLPFEGQDEKWCKPLG